MINQLVTELPTMESPDNYFNNQSLCLIKVKQMF